MTPPYEDDYERDVKRGVAASDLAIAASRLRDADDELVRHGRMIRDGDAGRGMPTWDEGQTSVRLSREVAEAYAAMRAAEKKWEEVRGA